MRKGAKAYVAANLISQVFALVRFALLARLLGAEQLGLAAMLLLTSQFFTSVADTGSDRFLIQDRDGDKPEMQGVIHLVLVVRGALIALALVLSAGLVASLFRAPALQPWLMAMAVAPLVGGFMHLDYRRVQRDHDFRPESASIIASEVVSFAATVAAALIVGDASAVVWGLVARAVTVVAVSHVTAQRAYRWALDRQLLFRFSQFGAPLFLNGLLLFFGSQGDRVIIGNGLGAEALGHYSAVLLLILYPTTMLIRLLVGFFLPVVSRARDVPERYAAERDRLGGRIVLLSVGILVGFAVVAPVATPLLYGPEFVQPLQLCALIGALQTARFLRVWPTTLANSIGRTTIILANNIARLAGLGLALVTNLYFPSLEAVVLAFFVGELVALVVALALLHRAGAVRLPRELGRAALFVAWTLAVVLLASGLQAGQATVIAGGAAAAALAAGLLGTERKALVESAGMVVRRLRRRGRPAG